MARAALVAHVVNVNATNKALITLADEYTNVGGALGVTKATSADLSAGYPGISVEDGLKQGILKRISVGLDKVGTAPKGRRVYLFGSAYTIGGNSRPGIVGQQLQGVTIKSASVKRSTKLEV